MITIQKRSSVNFGVEWSGDLANYVDMSYSDSIY